MDSCIVVSHIVCLENFKFIVKCIHVFNFPCFNSNAKIGPELLSELVTQAKSLPMDEHTDRGQTVIKNAHLRHVRA